MLAVYEIHFSYDGCWAYLDPDRRGSELYFAEKGSDWHEAIVEWHLPMVAPLDTANFLGALTVGPNATAGFETILERSGDLLPLAGEGAGWLAFRPHTRVEIVDYQRSLRREETPDEYKERAPGFVKHGVEVPLPAVVKYRMVEDRVVSLTNTVARTSDFSRLVAIEDEGPDTDVGNPAKCGFRAWVKHHGVTGVVFKKIWDSTDTVEYDPLWFYKMLEDPSYEWD